MDPKVTPEGTEKEVAAPVVLEHQPAGGAQKKKTPMFVIVLIVLVVLGIGSSVLGWVMVWQKSGENEALSAKLEKKDQADQIVAGSDSGSSDESTGAENEMSFRPLAFEKGGCLNCSGDNQAVQLYDELNNYNGERITITVGDKLCLEDTEPTTDTILTINWDMIKEFYPLEMEGTTDKSGTEKIILTEQINPDDVVQVMMGGFGHTPYEDTIFFVLRDGTIEYIPLVGIARTGEVRSYGKLPGVESVVRLVKNGEVVVSHGCTGGSTIYAQRADGKYYDLYDIINETGNY